MRIFKSGKFHKVIIKIVAVAFCICLTAGSFCVFFVTPAEVSAHTPGQDLEVRVGYFGDDMDYRTKTVLTRSDLTSLGMETHYYSNLTNVGTVMGVIAQGPRMIDVIEAAGIDSGSVQMIHLRTTDGQSGNDWFRNGSLNMDQWVNATRYYYPNLRSNYEITDDGLTLPEEGSLEDAQTVPAILAVKSFATKETDLELVESQLSDRDSYRFCAGQTALEEGAPSNAVSSMNSAYYVFGLDVQLSGSPTDITGMTLSPGKKKVKVGSKMKISVSLSGQELFEDKVEGDLYWESSDTSIATVDQNGTVTFKKVGDVTITVTDRNTGISQSVTVSGVSKTDQDEDEDKDKKDPSDQDKDKNDDPKPAQDKKDDPKQTPDKKDTDKDDNKKSKSSKDSKDDSILHKANVHEVIIGGAMYDRKEMAADAAPLEAQEDNPMAPVYAGLGAGICIGAGGITRLLLYLKEVR